LERTDFRREMDRRQLLQALAAHLRHGELAETDLRVSTPLPGREWARSCARRLWSAQMRRARLRPGRAAPQTNAPRIQSGDACVLGIVLAAPTARVAGLSGGHNAESVLRSLATGTAPEELYFYYGPEPGDRLDQSTAVKLFSVLQSAWRSPRSLPFGASPLVVGLVTAAAAVAIICQFHTPAMPAIANTARPQTIAPK
jgi:hypothetical protein